MDRRSLIHGWAAAIAALPVASMALPAAARQFSLPDDAEGAGGLAPNVLMTKAPPLLAAGRGDEATFWFYAGQLRYRAYLASHPDLDPSGEPALFAALMETVGRPVNEYAFGDVPRLADIIAKVLEWDSRHADPSSTGAARESARKGLKGLREQILAKADDIRAERRQRGLPNR